MPSDVRDDAALLDHDEWPLRWQRKLGLAPDDGMGLVRRALFFAMLAWLPLAAWAFLQGHALPGVVAEPLLTHFGINVRCLVAIPLLILAEGAALRTTVAMARQFVRNGLVTEAQRGAFAALLRDVARLRDSSLPWVVVLGLTLAWVIADPADPHNDALSWAVDGAGNLGFGAWWFAYVSRPIFSVLVLGWLWRIVVVFILFRRISKLDLALVPTHPDRAAGLGFLEYFPGAFALVTFAVTAVVGSGWAHDVVYHGERVESMIQPLALFTAVWALLMLSPLLAFAPKLMATKRQARLEYGRMVGEQGRLVRRRWILGESVAQGEMLEPAGVGPVADAQTLHDAVMRTRMAPIGKAALFAVLIPILLPMPAVFALQVPLKTMLLKVLKMLA